jgi:hypothetical protein
LSLKRLIPRKGEAMNDQEAMREISWIAREARRIVEEEVPRAEVAKYFHRKAHLLEYIASGQVGAERRETFEMAAKARDTAGHLEAGFEWPPYPQSISSDVL